MPMKHSILLPACKMTLFTTTYRQDLCRAPCLCLFPDFSPLPLPGPGCHRGGASGSCPAAAPLEPPAQLWLGPGVRAREALRRRSLLASPRLCGGGRLHGARVAAALSQKAAVSAASSEEQQHVRAESATASMPPKAAQGSQPLMQGSAARESSLQARW